MPQPAQIGASLESVFRREHGRIIASLIRLCGSFDRAEEAMQEAFAAALASPTEGAAVFDGDRYLGTFTAKSLLESLRRASEAGGGEVAAGI